MSIQDKLMTDIKAAMRNRDVLTRDTLRMLKAALDREAMELEEKGKAPLDHDAELRVIAREVKSRKDSAAQYADGGRDDLKEKELAEVAVLSAYLPKALTEAEARELMKAIAEEIGASGMKDMGALIKTARGRHPGALDGKLASTLAREILA